MLLASTVAAIGCGPPRPPVVAVAPTWLEVEVEGLRSSVGRVALALFASAESFAGDGAPLRREWLLVDDGGCLWRLDGLAPGDYAVKVYHDVDDSRALEVNFLGVPTEPYGFSNGARGSFGPPSWRQARFRLVTGRRLAVTVE